MSELSKSMVNEICIELAQGQNIKSLTVPNGSTILGVVKNEIKDLPAEQAFGIFGKLRSADYILQPGDRIELYQPLLIDPKDARRLRAKKAPKKS